MFFVLHACLSWASSTLRRRYPGHTPSLPGSTLSMGSKVLKLWPISPVAIDRYGRPNPISSWRFSPRLFAFYAVLIIKKLKNLRVFVQTIVEGRSYIRVQTVSMAQAGRCGRPSTSGAPLRPRWRWDLRVVLLLSASVSIFFIYMLTAAYCVILDKTTYLLLWFKPNCT